MKKHILLFFVGIFSCLQLVAIGLTTNLNPFAYNLSATLSADQSELTITYCLNADVTSLKIVIEGEGQTITHNVTAASKLKKTVADKPYFSPYEETISTDGLGAGTFTWRIEVTGAGRNEIQVYSQDGTNAHTYPFYLPSSVDIVKDTRSFNYGKVIVVEGSHSGKGNANFHSNEIGAGLYVFNPDFTPILNRNNKPGFNGGSATWGNTTNAYFANTTHAPRRVRVSKDGRIFVSSMYKHTATKHPYIHGIVLWEVDPYFSKWSTVMGAGVNGAKYDVTAISADNTTYYKNQLLTSGGSFIAAPCAGLDVRDEGAQLKLLLLSCDYRAFAANYQGFHLCEYNLGTATTWGSTPSKTFNVTTENATTNPTKRLFAAPTNSNVQYDKDGGVWCISNRAATSADQPALVHKNADLSEDYRNTTRKNTKNAGFRFNNDYTKVIIATEGSIGTIYDYTTKANGYFINPTQIDMSAAGEYLNDFAWDNANNIYAVAQNDNSNTGGEGKIAVYCMPYTSSDIFTTPGPTTLTIDCAEGITYTVETSVNDASMGSATGGGNIQSCELITLTATPKEGYRFVNWTIGGNVVSDANPYEFIVTKDVEVQANFAPAIFNVTWHNLLNNKNDLDNTGDLDNLEELWYLLTTYFNDYNVKKNSATGSKIRSRTIFSNGLSAIQTFFATGYVDTYIEGFLTNSTNKNYLTFTWLGDYINSVKSNTTSASGYYYWLSHFFAGYKEWPNYNQPSQWLPYYREAVCGLPKKMNYDDEMPIEIKEISPRKSEITNETVLSRTPYPTWYVRNYDANRLLAWREGSTSGPIVHQVDHDMALYATYVDRHISEVKDNTDVIRLMQNSGYAGTPHALTVDRKLQAGMYNTICFPFTVYINDEGGHSGLAANHPLKGATVLKLTGKDELYDESGEPVVVLNFEQVNTLEAGKPYLIKLADNKSSITEPINFTGVRYDDLTYINGNQTITTDDATISFHAMISPGNIPAEAVILVADNRLATITASGPMNGLRGYFTINDAYLQSVAKAGRLYLSMKKPVTTSIPVAPEAEKQTQPKVRKVMKNGIIYILRDGKAYDMMGRPLREL